MYLEIVTPEAVLFSGEVTSVALPGIDGEFQMLDNHAPIVSLLGKGITLLSITSGTIEMKDNKVIVLAD